ncbi:tyrosine-type recombinase/integrase [Stenoxybacter acetivorans]|uniref:tyrosine-type recombinase/integrase n=1 Tax=Stenoxybacter acetivorans TaxID=422441 RepID=UPI001FE13E25|nr:site-specific integrase [Stenoxybacter acetivorans]
MNLTTQGGKRIRYSLNTQDKRQAQELHDKIAHEQWRVEKLGDKPKYTWDEAAARWIKEKQHKRSINDDKTKIRRLATLRGIPLELLTRDFVMKMVAELPCGDSTKNRYLTLIRSVLNKCSGEWEWLDKAPKFTLYREPKKRIRFLTREEADRLILSLPELYADLAEFSFMTGLRQTNVLHLAWSQIDLNRRIAWIHADQSKSGRPIGVPLNNRAVSVLERRFGAHKTFAFVNERTQKPLNGICSKTWKEALQKAGLTDFRWHDIRHTWASWLIQSGVPLMDLKEMGGWESIEMVQKYAHLAPMHLHKNAVLLDAL